MPQKSIQHITVEEVCSFKENKDIKDLTLGRKIFNEYPKLFKNERQAYDLVRLIRGHKGKQKRHLATHIKPLTYDHTNTTRPFKNDIKTGAKVLILDIETAPIRAFVWGIWQQNVAINQIESDWFCLTWAAKWLFEKKVYSGKLTSEEAIKQDDRRIIRGVWELLNEADIVIAHNGQKFDIPKLNSRFIINKLQPPLPYTLIDTLTHIRRQFGFSSNKLDYVNKLLNLERKTDTGGFELWERCYKGEQKAINEMERYNINDVKILEETYLQIRAWIKPHPNMNLHILDEHESHCPTCGSKELTIQGKEYHTTANVFDVFRCGNCGSTGRKKLSALNLKQKRHLLLSIPK